MRWRKRLAAAILFAAFLTVALVDGFPRPSIILPAFSLSWIVGSRRLIKLKVLFAVGFAALVLLLWDHLLWTAARSSSFSSRDLVYRLYDANCTFPLPGSRYPHQIIRLRKGYPDANPTTSSGVAIDPVGQRLSPSVVRAPGCLSLVSLV